MCCYGYCNGEEEECLDIRGRHTSSLRMVEVCNMKNKKKCKAVPVTGRGVPYGCETSRLPHLLDSRLTYGGKVSLTRQPTTLPRAPLMWRMEEQISVEAEGSKLRKGCQDKKKIF
jgi:hypothetical protein